MEQELNNLIDWLNGEVDEHQAKENEGTVSWDRGYHNGAMTAAISFKVKVYEILYKMHHGNIAETSPASPD